MLKRVALALLLTAGSASAWAQTVVLSPWPKSQFFDNNGAECSGCKLFTYQAGTTTKQNSFTDSTGGTPNANPIILNSRGEASVWLTPALGYKFTLAPANDTDPPSNPFWTVNNILTNGLFGTATTTPYSSLNSLYFPTYSQLAAYALKLNLSGSVSDASGSFRDALYVENSDSDTTVYTNSHTNYGIRQAAFGPYSAGWLTTYKNIVAMNAYAQAATSGTNINGAAPGVSGINADATQWGAGIGDNEFAAHQPSAGSGSIAQSKSLAAVQAIIDANYADADSTHTAWAVLASNIGANKVTGIYGYSGTGTANAFIDAQGANVTLAAIYMPHSQSPVGGCSNASGSIIDYGRWNGNPAGGSYSWWNACNPVAVPGRFGWTEAGNVNLTLDFEGMSLTVFNSFNGYTVAPLSGAGDIAYLATGSWANGLNLSAATISDAALVLNTGLASSTIRYDSNNYTDLNGTAYEIHTAGAVQASLTTNHIRLNLPTGCGSSATGDLYNNAGVVSVCP